MVQHIYSYFIKYTYAVTAVDRLYNESEMITTSYIKRKKK